MTVYDDATIAITGGSGSFGHAFTRYALEHLPIKALRIFSRDEYKQAQMRQEFSDSRLRWLIGDIRDYDRIEAALNGVDIVIHAAAMKRIEVCEEDPFEAVKTNVLGTMNVARAAIQNKVWRGLFLSSDKASAAFNLYGGTKFVAEKCWIQANAYAGAGPTRFSAVRYGNVLGSRGSVLDVWQKQKDAGEALAITDKAMTRFWISQTQVVEFAQNVLEHMGGGEVFVPLMLSASMGTLADAFFPGEKQRVIPQRPGEKQHEDIISVHEALETVLISGVTDQIDGMVIRPQVHSWVKTVGGSYMNTGTLVPAWSSSRMQATAAQLRALIDT